MYGSSGRRWRSSSRRKDDGTSSSHGSPRQQGPWRPVTSPVKPGGSQRREWQATTSVRTPNGGGPTASNGASDGISPFVSGRPYTAAGPDGAARRRSGSARRASARAGGARNSARGDSWARTRNSGDGDGGAPVQSHGSGPATAPSPGNSAASNAAAPAGAAGKTTPKLYSFVVFGGNNPEVLRQAMAARPWWRVEEVKGPTSVDHVMKRVLPSADFIWKPTLFVRRPTPGKAVTTLHTVPPEWPGTIQLVNHFPEIKCLTSKTGLLRSMRKYYAARARNVFDNLPSSYIISSKDARIQASAEWKRFVKHHRMLAAGHHDPEIEKLHPKHCQENLWLLKPSFLNQGRGIEVFTDIPRLKRHVAASSSGKHEWVVQKYLERPLLLWKRKFDIRVWALVDDSFNIWIYKQGYLRTSSEEFSTSLDTKGSRHNKMVHLTNYCMQKHSKNLGRFEEGNTLGYSDLQAYLDEHMPNRFINFRDNILPRVNRLILDSLLAVKNDMREGTTRRCFELFGYDFMIDEDLRAWLIEVNTNPYLGVQNKWHKRLLREMVDDMLRLVVDPVFPPPSDATTGPPPKPASSSAVASAVGTSKQPPPPSGTGPCYTGDDPNRPNGFVLMHSESPAFAPPPLTGWEAHTRFLAPAAATPRDTAVSEEKEAKASDEAAPVTARANNASASLSINGNGNRNGHAHRGSHSTDAGGSRGDSKATASPAAATVAVRDSTTGAGLSGDLGLHGTPPPRRSPRPARTALVTASDSKARDTAGPSATPRTAAPGTLAAAALQATNGQPAASAAWVSGDATDRVNTARSARHERLVSSAGDRSAKSAVVNGVAVTAQGGAQMNGASSAKVRAATASASTRAAAASSASPRAPASTVQVCYLCCAPGHSALVTHPNGDKEPTCRVVFKYEWADFATHEVVSDETGAGLPAAWVNWYAVNKARGVDPRLMLCMLAMHRYRPRFLVEQFGTVTAALDRARKVAALGAGGSARRQRNGKRGDKPARHAHRSSSHGPARRRGRHSSGLHSPLKGGQGLHKAASTTSSSSNASARHRRLHTSGGARGSARGLSRGSGGSSEHHRRARRSLERDQATSAAYAGVDDARHAPTAKGVDYRMGLAATLRSRPSGSHRRTRSVSSPITTGGSPRRQHSHPVQRPRGHSSAGSGGGAGVDHSAAGRHITVAHSAAAATAVSKDPAAPRGSLALAIVKEASVPAGASTNVAMAGSNGWA